MRRLLRSYFHPQLLVLYFLPMLRLSVLPSVVYCFILSYKSGDL